MNLYEAIQNRKQYLSEKTIKLYAYQLLKAIQFMHKNNIFHRDIKPENILLKDDHLVLADLGSCKGIYAKPPFTEYVSTRWYRAPECIMTNGYYNYKMDMWGVGCVLFEITCLCPLFPGDNEIDQMRKIQNILGTPSQDVINIYKKYSTDPVTELNLYIFNRKGCGISKFLPHASAEFVDLLMKLLQYNPDDRYSAKQALQHAFFKEYHDIKNTNNNNNNGMLMRSFVGGDYSLSIIKSTEESQIMNGNNSNSNNNHKHKSLKQNKKNKDSSKRLIPNNYNVLPHVKRSTNGEQFSNRSGNDSYSEDNSLQMQNHQQTIKIKLPKVPNKMFSVIDNGSNNSNGNNNATTQYLKGISMMKQMNKLKQKYVSPYSQKVIFNMPPKHS